MNQQNKNTQALAINILEGILQKKGIQIIVEDYKTAYYKILIEAFDNKTRPTVEKIYFNSKISPLKVLWLIKLMYEKEKQKVPEQTKAFLQSLIKIIELGKTKKQREGFSMLDRDKYLQNILRNMIQKSKKNQSQKLKDFLKNYSNHQKYSNAINLLFVVEKTYHRNLNNHFSHFKSITSKNFNVLSKATHFIIESLKNRMFSKQSKVFNLLKLHSQRKKQLQAGLQRLRMFHEIHQKKRNKKAFGDILRYSISKNNSIIETEAKIFMTFKNLERIVSMGQLKSKIQAVRAFQDEFKNIRKIKKKALKKLIQNLQRKKKNTFQSIIKTKGKNLEKKSLKFVDFCEKLRINLKKSSLKQIKNCQNQSDIKLFKNYLQKWKENNITVKALNRKNYELKKHDFLQKIKNKLGGLEKVLEDIQKRNVRSTLNQLIKNTSDNQKIVDQNKVIQNTLTLANLVNYLKKKRNIEKFLALYKWRENAKKSGTYRYIKSKNELNESEIQFEYLKDYNYGSIDVNIFQQQKQKVFLTMLEYLFLKRKAQGMRSIALEANRIKTKEVMKIFNLMIKEIKMKQQMFWWRRLKANMNHQRIEDRKKKLKLQKEIEIKSFKKLKKLYQLIKFLIMSNSKKNNDKDYRNLENDLYTSGITETPQFKHNSNQKNQLENSLRRVSSFKVPEQNKRKKIYKKNLNQEIILEKRLKNLQVKHKEEQAKVFKLEQELKLKINENNKQQRKLEKFEQTENKLVGNLQDIGAENLKFQQQKKNLEDEVSFYQKKNQQQKKFIDNLIKQITEKDKFLKKSQAELRQSKELFERQKQNRFDFNDNIQESQLLNQDLEFLEPASENFLAQSFGPRILDQNQQQSLSNSQLFEDSYQNTCQNNYEYIKKRVAKLIKENEQKQNLLKIYNQKIKELQQYINDKDKIIDQYQIRFKEYIKKFIEFQKQQYNTNLYQDLDIQSRQSNSDDQLQDIMESDQSEKILQQHTEMQIQQTPLLNTKDQRNFRTISKIPKSKSQLNDSNDIKAKSLLNEFQYQKNENYEKYKLFKSPNERNYSDQQILYEDQSEKSSFQIRQKKDQSQSQISSNYNFQNIYEYVNYLKEYYRQLINSLRTKLECYKHLNEKIEYILSVYLDEKDFTDDDVYSFDELANFEVGDDYKQLMSNKSLQYFKNLNQKISHQIQQVVQIYKREIIVNDFKTIKDIYDQIKSTNLIVPFIKKQIQQKINDIQYSLSDQKKQDKIQSDLSLLKSKVISFLSSNSLKEIDIARRSVQKDDYEKLSQLNKEIKISKINSQFLKSYLQSIKILQVSREEDIMRIMKESFLQIKSSLKQYNNEFKLLQTEIQNIEEFGDSFQILKKMRKKEQSKNNIVDKIYQFFWMSLKDITQGQNFKFTDQIKKLKIDSLKKFLDGLNKELENCNFKKSPQNIQNQQVFEDYKYGDVEEIFKSRNQNQIENPFDYIFTQDIYNIKFFVQILSHFTSPKINQYIKFI